MRPDNTSCFVPDRPPQNAAVALVTAIRTGWTATAIVQAPGEAQKWFMTGRDGRVYRYTRSGTSFLNAGVVLDVRDRVEDTFQGQPYGELGLLGMALHPNFAQNGQAYLYYSAVGTEGTAMEARLSRFVSGNGGVSFDPASEVVLLRVPRISQYHWGGTMNFGPDGNLYIGFGDGGEMVQSQALGSLLGKMIRINVDGAAPYSVPGSNPFIGVAGARPEIYALGFRNPWKWSFDAPTGDMWLGDVGAVAQEEVNRVVKGGNYGWPIREGTLCTGTLPCTTVGLIDPYFTYTRTDAHGGQAVIGGHIYGGSAMPGLRGAYLYADVTGKLVALKSNPQGQPVPELLAEVAPNIQTFGQDEAGELYLASGGNVYFIAPAAAPQPSGFPQLLSQTGCMATGNPALPGPALIPYDVNSPLWSDGAAKERWFALPNGATIGRGLDGDFELPVGAVTVKSFRLNGRLVETRLFMRHADGEWAGYSYEWNDAQTDAVLLSGGKVKTVAGQSWAFPSRSQCLACHTEVAGRTLGLETAQLNRDLAYPTTGRVANQLATLDALGIFQYPLNAAPDTLDRLAAPADTSRALDLRARAYLHANCSYCHRPNGPGQGPEDFRYQQPGTGIGAVNVLPSQGDFGIPDARLIFPGKPAQSIVSHRLRTLALGRMPPLATSVVDVQGAALIDQWIRSGLGMGVADSDADGFADNVDNCRSTSNSSQLDSDGDGHGNLCDADFNNDNFVNALDLAILQRAFGSLSGVANYNASADMNGDGRINALDLALFQSRFGRPVGEQGSRFIHEASRRELK